MAFAWGRLPPTQGQGPWPVGWACISGGRESGPEPIGWPHARCWSVGWLPRHSHSGSWWATLWSWLVWLCCGLQCLEPPPFCPPGQGPTVPGFACATQPLPRGARTEGLVTVSSWGVGVRACALVRSCVWVRVCVPVAPSTTGPEPQGGPWALNTEQYQGARPTSALEPRGGVSPAHSWAQWPWPWHAAPLPAELSGCGAPRRLRRWCAALTYLGGTYLVRYHQRRGGAGPGFL